MPKFPGFSYKVSNIKNAVFEKFREKMDVYGSEMVRLHIGDTYQRPYYNIPLTEKFLASRQNFNRYCNTFGIAELRKVLKEKLNSDNGIKSTINNILMTAGATNALSAALHTVLNQEDEILVFTPCWPIFPGLVKSVPAKIVEVPFYMTLDENPDLDIESYLNRFISPKTAAVYFNSPNNPSGKVLSKDQINAIGGFASSNNLWILSDEAYDGLTYDDQHHICIASLPAFSERTISVFTFSKLYMFAGLRLGYAVASEVVIKNINKTMVHQLYSPSTFAQQMMIEPIKTRHEWTTKVRQHYQDLRDIFFETIDLLEYTPQAGYFTFFSIESFFGKKTYNQIIDECLEQGVSVAPGEDFGKGYENYIRICFTGEPEERLKRGAMTLRNILLG